jgi:hypothetical protein
MIGFMKSMLIDLGGWKVRSSRVMVALWIALLLAGCALPVPLPTELPVEIPGMPANWDDLDGLMGELGIPDLSTLSNVPGLDVLSGLQTPAGAIAFQGPVEMVLQTGERIPGTDILFVGLASVDEARFEINGLAAPRRLGDSLDFDGAWPGLSGVTYHLRLRMYRVTDGQVRAAGVQRLVVEDVQPQAANVETSSNRHVLRFPHTVTSVAGGEFPGMTLGYRGQDDRGATLSGLPEGEYPYRKIGDSIEWAGRLTPDLAVEYHLRLLYYQEANATVGGVVVVSLPGQ